MKKASKGVIAASAGAVLLLGGGGTMAYWSDGDTVEGGDFASGQLRLETDVANAGCEGWVLDDPEGTVAYTAAVKIVPGDVIKRHCEFTIKAEGTHLEASVDISDVNFTTGGATGFAGMLTAAVSDLKVDGVSATGLTSADDEKTLSVDIAVTFDSAALNNTQDLSTALDNLTITTTQAHG